MTLWACATQPPHDAMPGAGVRPEEVLPLERVRLYSSGVGYFERAGRVDDEHGLLPVPSGHLDDALKTLVLMSPKNSLSSVTFPSRVSPAVARARAGLPASDEAAISYDRLLVALRGQEVELELSGDGSGGDVRQIRGRVIEVVAVGPEHPAYDHGPPHRTLTEDEAAAPEKERLYVLLLSEDGEILRFDSTRLASVRPVDRAMNQRLHAALSARLGTRAGKAEALALSSGLAGADVRVAYLAETPTWRASYRLILGRSDAAQKPRLADLQGWALVHNDTDERWRGVRMELVDSRPTSFLFPMAAPRYERRDLETPDLALSSVPQLSTTTPDALWGDFSDYEGEPIVRLGTSEGIGLGSAAGFGSGHGRLGGSHRARAPRFRAPDAHVGSDLLWAGNLATRAGVRPPTDQATSVFPVEQALDVRPQHSALVPLLGARIQARPIVWFSHMTASPERAVGITNTTHFTLPEGPLAAFEPEGFLGEALLERLKPGARQFARIGDEPDVELRTHREPGVGKRRHVDFWQGQLRTHSIRTQTTKLWFDNQSGRRREAYVSLDIVLNAAVEGSDRVDFETTSGTPLAVFILSTGSSGPHTLVTREAVSRAVAPIDVDLEHLDERIADDDLPAAERAILSRARPVVEDRDRTRQRKRELDVEIQAVSADLERLRKHVGSLGSAEASGGAALTPLIERILQRDAHFTELETERRAVDQKLEAGEEALVEILREFEDLRPAILQARDKARRG